MKLGKRVSRNSRRSQGGGDDPLYKRIIGFVVVIGLVFVASVARLAYLQIGGTERAKQAANIRTVIKTSHGVRGMIVDTNGQVLAQSVERYTMYADQNGAKAFQPVKCTGKNSSTCHSLDGKNLTSTGVEAVAELLAPVLGKSVMELGGMLTGDSSYVVIEKDVTPELKEQVEDLHLSTVIGFEETSQRIYPSDTLLGDVLGGVDNSGTGVAGIELMMNDALSGVDGSTTYQAGATGQVIPGTELDSTAALNGGTVTLTIDRDVQWYVEKVLKEQVEKENAAWGIAIVQETKTGKLLAVADTSGISAGGDEAKTTAAISMTETFEPGSLGKVITTAALIQEGLHKATDQFTVPSSITIDGQTYQDAESHATKRYTLAGILQYSSNVGTIMASENYPLEKRYEYLKKFGIGESTGIGFPGESTGLLSNYTDWDGRTQNVVLFGQGYAVTALQILNAISTVANGGVRVGQSLIESATDANGNDVTPRPNDSVQVVSADAASDTLNAMESVAEHYQRYVGVPGYRTAGKTGTAQVAGADGNLTSHIGDYVTTIPANDPQFTIGVFVKDPASGWGVTSAGPVTAEIGQFLMEKYQVAKSPARTDAIATEW